MIHRSLTPRQIAKRSLGDPDTASAADLDDFLRETRANHYLYFKGGENGCRVASSQCRTSKDSIHRFERKLPEQGRRDFLDGVYFQMCRLTGHADPQVRQRAHVVVNLCIEAAGTGHWMGLQATPELKGAVAALREAMDRTDRPASGPANGSGAPPIHLTPT